MSLDTLFDQIDALNHNDFEQLISHVDKQKRRRAREILSEAQRQASRFVADLDSRGVKPPSDRKPAKYANPKNPDQTWSGLGRKPDWVKAHLSSGGKIEELSV